MKDLFLLWFMNSHFLDINIRLFKAEMYLIDGWTIEKKKNVVLYLCFLLNYFMINMISFQV